MPTYDYECAACRGRFEVVHGVHGEGPTACPLCGKGPVRKVITAANVHYKGSGWAKKERRTTPAGASKGGTSPSGSDEGPKSDAAASSDTDGSGSSPKKTESGSTGSSGAGASKTTEKASTSGASKTSD